jgi:hypothetical protein
MIQYSLIIILVLAMSGCASLNLKGGIVHRFGQERKLARAVTLLEDGKITEATAMLTAICSESGVPGVTDEALFRLSLLRLESIEEKNGTLKAQHDLERLQKEYPSSSWTPLASSLSEFLSSADDVRLQGRDIRHQDRKLKELNLSLTKENKELRERIEKLKNLELEMGRGTKR